VGQAIGDLLPAAVGVAISPLPIAAVILMLVSARGRANGAAFLAGWVVGVAGAGTILLLLAGGAGASEERARRLGRLVEAVPRRHSDPKAKVGQTFCRSIAALRT
jgi:hypothetical protein